MEASELSASLSLASKRLLMFGEGYHEAIYLLSESRILLHLRCLIITELALMSGVSR